jgi:spermidine synthase
MSAAAYPADGRHAAGVAEKDKDPARLVGAIYGANTVGAIAGSILFSLVFVPAFGTRGSERLMVAFSGLAAILVLACEIEKRH